MVKFLHAADVHLDSPFAGLVAYDGAPVDLMRSATRRALENLVDLATSEDVSFVVIAGDLYDGDWRDYNTGLFFAAQMAKLREAGVKVFIATGNHDAASQITRSLRMPENVTVMPVDRPKTVILDDDGIAIHGQGFKSRSVQEDMAAGYPDPDPQFVNIGLLHTSADGRPGHDTYAPCSPVALAAKGYQYWALGHVHRREVVRRDPWIVFPGNTQGRNARETGPKGCTLVSIEDGAVLDVQPRELNVVRWDVCDIDVSDARTGHEAVERTASTLDDLTSGQPGFPLAVRVTLVGPSSIHSDLLADPERWANDIRAVATDVSSGRVWVEKVRLQTRPTDDPPTLTDSALGELQKTMTRLADSPELLAELATELSALAAQLPPELRASVDGLDLRSPKVIRRLSKDAASLGLCRLLGREAQQ